MKIAKLAVEVSHAKKLFMDKRAGVKRISHAEKQAYVRMS
jgi:hypothetical protein